MQTVSMKKTRIIIVDDHPVVRYGITQLINAEPNLEVTSGTGSAKEAMRLLEKQLPDLAIIDLSLDDINGIELIENIHAKYPLLPMIALSMHDESLYAERVLRAGGRGYVMKQAGTETLIEALNRVIDGKVYLSDEMADRLISKIADHKSATHDSSPIESLSNRELEVFELIGRGIKTGRIAEKLNLSVKTIETYRNNIKHKLNIDNSAQLTQQAILWVNSLRSE